jgi:hypothetical protein
MKNAEQRQNEIGRSGFPDSEAMLRPDAAAN